MKSGPNCTAYCGIALLRILYQTQSLLHIRDMMGQILYYHLISTKLNDIIINNRRK